MIEILGEANVDEAVRRVVVESVDRDCFHEKKKGRLALRFERNPVL